MKEEQELRDRIETLKEDLVTSEGARAQDEQIEIRILRWVLTGPEEE